MREEHEQLSLDGLGSNTAPPVAKARLAFAEPTVKQLAFGAGEKSFVRADDGLLARVVHRHSARKAYYVRRYAEIVGTAMARHWSHIWWVELLCAGNGRNDPTVDALSMKGGQVMPGFTSKYVGDHTNHIHVPY
jgi:hypothetical protein